jgi:hypothetical protein
MIERVDDLPDYVDGLRFSGHVSREEYKQVVLPLLHECLARGGGIRLLIVIDAGFARFEAGALWEDLKFGLGPGLELSRWERIALVSDADWPITPSRCSAGSSLATSASSNWPSKLTRSPG